MKSRDYWHKRFELLEEKQIKKGIDAYHEIARQYNMAIRETEKQISAWYSRYATENGITLAEAKKLLAGRDLEAFRMDVKEYIKKGQSLDPQWLKQLEQASVRVHVSRLEALKLQMQQQAEALHGYELDALDKVARDIYTDGYYRTAFEVAKGSGVSATLAALDTGKIDKVISKPWCSDGRNFSARVWNNRTKLVDELHTLLTQNIIKGEAPDKVIKALSKRFEVSKSAAGRLVMTESAYFSSAAQHDSFKDVGVEEFEFVATLDNNTSDICQGMDGQHFKMSEFEIGVNAPPLHCNCRSTTVPYFEDLGGERASRDEEGKYKTVPADMTYKDWKNQFVGVDDVVFDELTNVINFTDMNKDEINNWVKDYYELNSDVSLTEAELKALDDYGEGGYGVFNGVERFARGTPEYERLVKSYGKELVEKTYERSKRLESALSKFKLDQNVELHRAVRDVSYITGGDTDVETLKKMIGQTYTEKGYVSTGLNYQSKFMGTSKNGVHMEILAPKGTNGAYIDKYVAKNEMEFLINKGQKFKILDAGERIRIVKKPKFDLKTHQWKEITEEVTERFMKVQLIAEKTGVVAKTAKAVENVKSINKIKDFDELKRYMKNTHNVSVSDSVKKLDFESVRESLEGVEKVLNEFPQARSSFKSVDVRNGGIMSAGYEGDINFNPVYYKTREKAVSASISKTHFHPTGNNVLSTGSHETGHILEKALIDKIADNPTMGKLLWADKNIAKSIVSDAVSNAKKLPDGKGKLKSKLIGEISEYARSDSSECLAEAVADYILNGEKSAMLSKEIWKLLKKELG